MPIEFATFTTNGNEILLHSSMRKFFYIYDVTASQSHRISNLESKQDKGWTSSAVSPDSEYIAMLGKDGISLLSGNRKIITLTLYL